MSTGRPLSLSEYLYDLELSVLELREKALLSRPDVDSDGCEAMACFKLLELINITKPRHYTVRRKRRRNPAAERGFQTSRYRRFSLIDPFMVDTIPMSPVDELELVILELREKQNLGRTDEELNFYKSQERTETKRCAHFRYAANRRKADSDKKNP